MTYPKVTVGGYNLPEPFDGIDDREHIDDHKTEAVYYPSRYEIQESGVLYLEWHNDCELDERLWISPENYSWIKPTHDHE